jgi:hypothetical protein
MRQVKDFNGTDVLFIDGFRDTERVRSASGNGARDLDLS